MAKKLLIATKNPGKFQEIKTLLEDLPLEIVFLKDLEEEHPEIQETGTSFAENALMKAEYYAGKTGMMTLADDSGIQVEALEGEMGVETRRWGKGANATDEEWVEHFLKVMEDYPRPAQRRARFVCHVAVVDGEEKHIFAGQVRGRITEKLEAPIIPGLPLSSCFRSEGCKKVFAALTREEKGKVSHRGEAILRAKGFIDSRIRENDRGGNDKRE